MSRLPLGLALASIALGATALGCAERPDDPPPPQNTDAQVHLGGGVAGGQGGEASVNACVASGGVCMIPGDANICPQVSGAACPVVDQTTQVCCVGFNDAGAPDVFVSPDM